MLCRHNKLCEKKLVHGGWCNATDSVIRTKDTFIPCHTSFFGKPKVASQDNLCVPFIRRFRGMRRKTGRSS